MIESPSPDSTGPSLKEAADLLDAACWRLHAALETCRAERTEMIQDGAELEQNSAHLILKAEQLLLHTVKMLEALNQGG